jgi:hypothetical protein
MAMLSTSLSGPKSATSYCAPEFSGLRRSCPNSNSNNSNSHSQSFLRFCSPRKPLKSVVAMAGTGTVRFELFFFHILLLYSMPLSPLDFASLTINSIYNLYFIYLFILFSFFGWQ